MIRRNIQLADGTAAWLLISQVEHARISGELTSVWREPFDKVVVDAITHHDDGWATWEAAPQMDARRGRPLSFLETPIDAALAIWNDSIMAARLISPLAGAIVAGHFLGLAGGSDQAKRPLPAQWLSEMATTRASWLIEWQQQSTDHTLEVAERGQRMLLTADLLSLWLCCDGPVNSVDAGETSNAEMMSRTAAVLGKYHFTEASKTVERDAINWKGTLVPWPFSKSIVRLATRAIVVPAQNYSSWAALLAASQPVEVRWGLRETLPTSGEC